jgi:hypothetical protein
MDDLVQQLDKRANTYNWDSATFYISDAHMMRQAAAEIRRLREREARLQAIIDSRPAINAGLPETYIKWSQSVMLVEAAQAAGVVQ